MRASGEKIPTTNQIVKPIQHINAKARICSVLSSVLPNQPVNKNPHQLCTTVAPPQEMIHFHIKALIQ